MSNIDYTHMTIVLDRSGSMSRVKNDTEGGFNAFIEKQREVKGKATLTLVQFDTTYEFVHKGVALSEVKALVLEPRGSTALFDAIGRGINETGEYLKAMSEADRPGHVLFVIITDGEENASREFDEVTINAMITQQRDVYKWTFVFIGANQDAMKAGSAIGVAALNNLQYTANSVGTSALYRSFDAATTNLRASSTSSTMSFFTKEDRDEQSKAAAKD